MSTTIIQALAADPLLFRRRKVVVVGDIAFDRTYLCRTPEPGFHATHASETIFDVEPGGDDHGAVGSANNVCLSCAALGARTSIWTITGDDEEGRRVSELLRSQPGISHVFPLAGVQTVTRLRFFVRDQESGRYHLAIRVDKEPDYAIASKSSTTLVAGGSFLSDFEADLQDADALVLNDTQKGMLCPGVISQLSEVVERVGRPGFRASSFPLTVLVDPKFGWHTFSNLPVDVLKPNSREAAHAAGLRGEELDLGSDVDLRRLGIRLAQSFGSTFPRIVVTLGAAGAALLERTGDTCRLTRFFPFSPGSGVFDASTHCGDVFGAALVLAFCHCRDWHRAVPFANLVASKQCSKPTATRVTLQDVLKPNAPEAPERRVQEPVLVAEWPTCPETR